MGSILDMLHTEFDGQLDITAIEVNRTLEPVLSAKGHDVVFSDFLEHQGQYDRILMNPPFEGGSDIDHVMHAFDCLKPGGRLVSIMSEGPFFRSDKTSKGFRAWHSTAMAKSIELPAIPQEDQIPLIKSLVYLIRTR